MLFRSRPKPVSRRSTRQERQDARTRIGYDPATDSRTPVLDEPRARAAARIELRHQRAQKERIAGRRNMKRLKKAGKRVGGGDHPMSAS